MTQETFENAPISVAEHKAEKADDAGLWTPRDALVSLLRDIDSGKRDVTGLVICYAQKHTDGSERPHYMQANKGFWRLLGLIELVKHMMLTESNG